jgi:hypothetical protein
MVSGVYTTECPFSGVMKMPDAGMDFDEIVDVIALSEEPGKGEEYSRGAKVATLPLYKAVRLVIQKFGDTPLRRSSATIMRRGELIKLTEIRKIYDRADFPRGKA